MRSSNSRCNDFRSEICAFIHHDEQGVFLTGSKIPVQIVFAVCYDTIAFFAYASKSD